MISVEEAILKPALGMQFINGFDCEESEHIFNEWQDRLDPIIIDKITIDYCAYKILEGKTEISKILKFKIEDKEYLLRAYNTNVTQDQQVIYCLANDKFKGDSGIFVKEFIDETIKLENCNYIASITGDYSFVKALRDSNISLNNPLNNVFESISTSGKLPDKHLSIPLLSKSGLEYHRNFQHHEDVHPDYLEFFGIKDFNKNRYNTLKTKKYDTYFINTKPIDNKYFSAELFVGDKLISLINYINNKNNLTVEIDIKKDQTTELGSFSKVYYVVYTLLHICNEIGIKNITIYKPNKVIQIHDDIDLQEAEHIFKLGKSNQTEKRRQMYQHMMNLAITDEKDILPNLQQLQGVAQTVINQKQLRDFESTMDEFGFKKGGNKYTKRLL